MTRASLRMRNPKVIYSVVSTTRDFDAFDETALELYKKLNIHPGTVVHNAFTNIAEANQRARDLLRAAYFDGSGKNPMERLERVEEVITYENGCLTMKEYPLINKQYELQFKFNRQTWFTNFWFRDGSRYPYMVNVNAVQITRTQNPPVVKSQTQPKPKVPNNQAPTPTSKPLTKAERKQANKEKQAEQQRLAQERRRKRQEELQSANSKRQNSARKSRSARPAQHTDSSFIPDTLPTTQASPDSGHPTKPLTAYKLIKAVCFVGRDSDSVDEADLGGTSINSWYLDKANAFEALVKEVIVAPKIVGTRTPNTFFIQYDVDEGLAYWINDME